MLTKTATGAHERTSDQTLNERMAAFIAGTGFEDFEPAVAQKAKELILYNVGLGLIGKREKDANSIMAVRAARRWSPYGGPSTIMASPWKAMPIDASFANCTQMRAFGLDDVIFPAGIHAALETIPVALAMAEENGCSGREVLAAIILGYEVMGKLGTFTWHTSAPRRPTMAYGTFGSVIAAGRVLGLTQEQHAHAIGYAAHSAQGLAESDFGPVTHYYSLVCRAGITGAVLASEGGVSSRTVMEGLYGFLEIFTGNHSFDQDAFIASLGTDYQILRAVEKRYPGTGLNIVAIEAMREIVNREKLTPATVKEVRVFLPEERTNFLAGHSTGPFISEITCPSSVCYQLGIMLMDGKLDFARYRQYDNPEVLASVAKVRPILVPGKRNIRWMRVEVDAADGRTLVREGEDYAFPAITPYDRFSAAAEGVLPKEQAERFFELVMKLDESETIAPAMACLVTS